MSAVTTTVAPLGPELVRARRRRGAPRPRPDARPFDPSRAGRLPSAHRRVLVLVFEAFARALTTTLGGQLRTAVSVSLRSVDQRDYQALISRCEDPTWVAAVTLEPVAGLGVIEVPIALGMVLAERLLGGAGSGPHPPRGLTDLEQVLVRRLLDIALQDLTAALAPLCELRPVIARMEHQPELLKASLPTDAYATMDFAVELLDAGAAAERLTIALPLAGLEGALEAFVGSVQPAAVTEHEPAAVGDHLLDAPVEIALRFGPVTLHGSEILALREGQLVPFGHRTSTPLFIDVEGVPFLPAKPGRIGRRLACVVVDQPIDPSMPPGGSRP